LEYCGEDLGWNIVDSGVLEDAIFKLKLRVAEHIGVQKGMIVVDVGCGQGGFTASLAKIVGEEGRVLAIDVSDEYLTEFMGRLDRYGVRNRVTFLRADGANLRHVIADDFADMVVSFRVIEELKTPADMPKIIGEMVRVARKGGKVCLTELSTAARNKAEELYLRLHRESGDFFPEREEIAELMKRCGLEAVRVEKFGTDLWLSPSLSKQDLSFAQVWFDLHVERNLGSLIDAYGMKYPELLVFSAQKCARGGGGSPR
jgi:cyclopropane fatty-acyl-phospholipid synthase-like methyltransferase